MKKKLRFAGLLLIPACLYSCNNKVVDNDTYIPSDPKLVDDSYLTKYDEIGDMHENSMVLPSVGGGEANQAADPFVYRYNGYYYLVPTTTGKFIRGYKSKDLIHWEKVNNNVLSSGYVYDASKDSNPIPYDTPFAPEITYYNGNFYIICSPSGKGHFVLKSKSIDGPYSNISGNIEKFIDGSYFINDDGHIYLFTCDSNFLKMYEVDKDFYTFVKMNGNEDGVYLTEANLGKWNEGPYLLKRDGKYYLTYTGTHYLSSSYRVDYNFVNEGSDITKPSSYINKGNLLISTEDDFRGLGHSSTVLGPDLDSYYIVYHNLDSSVSNRYLNVSRLSFNGSRMVADYVGKENNISPKLADYSCYDISELEDKDDFMLSNEKTKGDFTVEFNSTGFGKMIFSYIDKNNYSYITINDDLDIELIKVKDNKEHSIYVYDVPFDIDTEVNHTFRVSYAKGETDLYFDNIEIGNDIISYFKGGKVGYSSEFTDLGYLGFSNVGQGESDKLSYKQDKILANSYDDTLSYLRKGSGLNEVTSTKDYIDTYSNNLTIKNKNDRATYRIYANKDDDYYLGIRINSDSLNKKIGIRVDDDEIYETTLSGETPIISNGDVYLNIGPIYLTSGQHNLSIYNVGDEITFSSINLINNINNEDLEIKTNSKINKNKLSVIGDPIYNNEYITLSGDMGCGFTYKNNFINNYEIEYEFDINSFNNDLSYLGLLFNTVNFTRNYPGDAEKENNPNMYDGYKIEIKNNSLALKYNNFNYNEEIDFAKINLVDGKNKLKVSLIDNVIKVTLNNKEILNSPNNVGRVFGNVGAIMYNGSANIYDIKTTVL